MVRLVLKFTEEHHPSTQRCNFVSSTAESYDVLNEWLNQHLCEEILPLFTPSPGSGGEASPAEKKMGLDRFFNVHLDVDIKVIEARLSELMNLSYLEEVYIEGQTLPA